MRQPPLGCPATARADRSRGRLLPGVARRPGIALRQNTKTALLSGSLALSAVPTMTSAAETEPADNTIVVTGKTGAYNVTRSSGATRTDTPLLEVPQSVTVLTRQVVDDLQANRVEDVLAYAGGITRGNNFGGTGLTDYNLRGFTTSEYFRNGFPMNRGYPPAPDSIAVERVEVLRGPAALLYGRGDPGGTFNIVSRVPTDRMAQTVSGRIDSFGGWRGTVDATGPIDSAKTVRYRLGAAVEGGDSFRDHVQSDRIVVAPVVAWDASPDLTFILSSEFVQVKTPLDRGNPAFSNQLDIAIPASRFFGEPSVGRWRVRNGLGSLVAEYKLAPGWKLRAGAQYYNGELGGPGIQASSLRADGRTLVRTYSERTLRWRDLDAQVNLTGQFATGSVEHEVLLGAEFEAFHYTEVIRNSSPTLSPFTLDIFAPVYGSAIPPLNGTFTSIHADAHIRGLRPGPGVIATLAEAAGRRTTGAIRERQPELAQRGHFCVQADGIYAAPWDGLRAGPASFSLRQLCPLQQAEHRSGRERQCHRAGTRHQLRGRCEAGTAGRQAERDSGAVPHHQAERRDH